MSVNTFTMPSSEIEMREAARVIATNLERSKVERKIF
jgi:hypothetical protein